MPKPIHLYNTLSRSIELLEPLNSPKVDMYTCGPTVYGDAHIGNFRTYIFEDVLVKTLRHFGYIPNRVMNITDVGHLTSDEDEGEDKLEVGAKRDGITAWEVAKKYEVSFLKGLEALNIEVPSRMVRATDTIAEQISFIEELEQKGFTYQIADGVYFDSSKVEGYGKLARLDVEGLQAGARVAMQDGKRRPTDFALWKLSKGPGKRDMEWESPWGVGFPGWHIECSAIALKELGPELDIHCGGVDHIPIHHTNEIAQSEALTGKPLAKMWMHNEFLLVDGGKMSKSLGNGYTLADLEERGFSALDFRFFTYSASYRSKLNFTWEALEASKTSLDRLRNLVQPLVDVSMEDVGEQIQAHIEKGEQALSNDLNTSELLAVTWEVLKSDLSNEQKALFIREFEPILSLGLLVKGKELEIPTEILALLEQRKVAREAKNWQESDFLRDQIEKKGYEISDTNGGENFEIRKK